MAKRQCESCNVAFNLLLNYINYLLHIFNKLFRYIKRKTEGEDVGWPDIMVRHKIDFRTDYMHQAERVVERHDRLRRQAWHLNEYKLSLSILSMSELDFHDNR